MKTLQNKLLQLCGNHIQYIYNRLKLYLLKRSLWICIIYYERNLLQN